ncbi:sulfotransferase domain-containing protein [Actinoplanes sp. TBRC 11911]|uniref:sulfotransferase domain-containing protein n=1 Tax=Actinoplanes sp. TBRC 11911 TaxID=2729386 RepID=UPI00145C9927|nr:sulfotransferase domain-containing protein [Actinoplanes sp. TBRC 11911]NMO53787.1 sulfotransferase domain-containing protein [Actinoplanes sp. TBRC 11911]
MHQKHYRNAFIDSSRWDDIALREGDIILTTPPKTGTTWMQMICALLIFQTPELPRPLGEISVWPDFLVHPREEVLAELDGQRHRRVIKTHTPLDGLPYDERVTYLTIGREPRDVGVSTDNHMSNMHLGKVFAAFAASMAAEGAEVPALPEMPPPPESVHDRFRAWVDDPGYMSGLPMFLHHLDTLWQVRDRPNVVLTHYQQLQDDLAASMRSLAAKLDIEVPEQKWPELVEAATFDSMKRREDDVIPNRDLWVDKARFLHKGTSGQWRSVLDEDDVAYYRKQVVTLADPDLLAWVQQGQD